MEKAAIQNVAAVPGKCTVFGGGKCPNLGVANVRILGVVNVLLVNDTQSLGLLCYSQHFSQNGNRNLFHSQLNFCDRICCELAIALVRQYWKIAIGETYINLSFG